MMTLSHGVQNINYRQYRLEVRYQGRGWKVFIYPPGAQGPSYAAPFVKRVDEKRKDRSVSRVSSREPLDRAVFFPYPKYGIVEQPISDQSYQFRCDALEALLPHDATTLIVNSRGRPWTPDGFRVSMFKLLGALEEEGRVGPGLTVHGLRHTVGTIMREAGFDKDTVADMLGQDTAEMAEWYAREAVLDRKLERVVEALDEHMSGTKVSNSAE